MQVRTRVRANEIVAGDVLAIPGTTVSRVIPTRKGDKVQVYAGEPTPTVVPNDQHIWVMRGPVSQAPSA